MPLDTLQNVKPHQDEAKIIAIIIIIIITTKPKITMLLTLPFVQRDFHL